MPTALTLVNGCASDAVPVSDRGLHYGDGLFETMAVRNGMPCLWEPHMLRLEDGCRRLGIAFPGREALWHDVTRLLDRPADGVLKVVVTRGVAGRGYRPPKHTPSTRIASIAALPDYPASFWTDGVAVKVCGIRLSEQPVLAGIKHLNRLEQVLARSEWTDEAVGEGLMLTAENRVIEGTMTNLLAIRGGVLLTPDLQAAGVSGVMRARVMALATEMGLAVRERDLILDELFQMDEILLSNSLIGVWPIKSIDGRRVGHMGMASRVIERLNSAGDIPRVGIYKAETSPNHA